MLLTETRHHEVKDRGALESQLREYGDKCLNRQYKGLALHHEVYGAIPYGTEIRFFKVSKKADGTFVGKTYSGELDVPNEEAYWDLKTDGILIYGVLKKIWKFGQDMVGIIGA